VRTDSSGPRSADRVKPTPSGPGRPSISPLLWVAAAAWAASRAGTEIALSGWQSGSMVATVIGCGACLALLAVAVVSRRPVLHLLAVAAACAMGMALASGVSRAAVASGLDSQGPTSWSATVVADPADGSFGTDVLVRLEGVGGSPAIRVSWPADVAPPAYGQRVDFDARLREVVRVGDAGARSFRDGELLRATPWRVRVVGWVPGPFGAVCAWRQTSIDALRAQGGPGGEALASMLFGAPVREEGAAALEDAKTAGVAWAIAASGLHLSVIVLLAERLAGILGASRRGRSIAALVALAVLGAAAGMRLSLLRAAIAATAAVLAHLVGRRRDATAALGAAIALLVMVDPSAAYDAGLLLGAAAVSGIALLSALANAWLVPVIGKRTAWSLGGSVAAQASVVPLAASMFGAVSLLGPVTLAVSGVPVQIAVALGALGAVVAPLSRQFGQGLSRAGVVAADLATRVWQVAARVPGALLAVPAPPWWLAGAWIAGGALLWLRWPIPRRALRVRVGVSAVIAALVCTSAFAAPVAGLVEVLDVGQGDCILIRDAGQAVLVDTGPDPVVLRQALARAGVHRLDGLVLTHAHEDHIGGLDGLAGVARPGWIGVPDVQDPAVSALAARAASDADSVVSLRRGMEFSVGRVKVRVLWPRGGDVRLSANDTSVILLLEKDGHRALLLGDAEAQAQSGALEAWSGRVEMLKVAHHGSVNGNVPEALAIWRPSVALISVGAGNKFGHPSAEALATLGGMGVTVRRTDLEGDLGWEPARGAASEDVGLPQPLCDNRSRERRMAGLPPSRGQVRAWQQRASAISSRSISYTARKSCCSSAPRSGCTTGSRPSPISISTMRRSTGPRSPSTT